MTRSGRAAIAAGLATMVCAVFLACSSSSSSPPPPRSPEAGSDAEAGLVPEAAPGETGPTDAGAGLTCGPLLNCDNACSSNACTDACYAQATAHAQGLFNNLTNCIAETCSSADGGPCASPSSAQCSQCNMTAATGACVSFLTSCFNDTQKAPPDPSGDAQVIDAGVVDAGPRIGCGVILTCEQGCATSDVACQTKCFNEGTATAQALDMALANCVVGACPASDGGPCSDAGMACTGCEEQSYYGTCVATFTACNTDNSASPDGGTEPVALHCGPIMTLASGLDQPQAVLIQNGEAYFSEITSTGPVLKVPIDGGDGGAPSTVAPSEPYPMGLAIDANNIYVWNSGSFSGMGGLNNSDGTIVQIPLSGGAPITLATGLVVAFDAPYANAIAVDSKNVYWVTGGPGVPGQINAAPIGGGSPAKVLYGMQSFPEAAVTDGTNLYWSDWGTFDAQGNYNGDGTILKAPVGGVVMPTQLASSQLAPASLALDGNNLYWTNTGKLTPGGLAMANSGSVMQVALAGGSPVPLATTQNIPIGIAVGAGTVYWTEFGFSVPGDIKSVPIGGGMPTTVVTNAADPFGLAVSAGVMYWTKNVPTGTGEGVLYSCMP